LERLNIFYFHLSALDGGFTYWRAVSTAFIFLYNLSKKIYCLISSYCSGSIFTKKAPEMICANEITILLKYLPV